MNEPLAYFIEKYGFDYKNIKKIVSGEKYCAVLLKNGNVGVCATLFNKIELKISDLEQPDLTNVNHRVVINAYFNAVFNSKIETENKDITEISDFAKYETIVMIGFFKPVIAKLKNVNLLVFDDIKNDAIIQPKELKEKSLQKADAVILSATTIFNGSFSKIINKTKTGCEVFLLGPSCPMTEDMFNYKNIKALFGTSFSKNDNRVLETIARGEGTRYFQKFGTKIYLNASSLYFPSS